MNSPLNWTRQSIFRKLNLQISLLMLFIFLSLGFITYFNFYRLIQNRDEELLSYQVQKAQDKLKQTLEQYKDETSSLYETESNIPLGFNQYFLPPFTSKTMDARKQYEWLMTINNYMATILNRNPNAVNVAFYRISDKKLLTMGQLDIDNVNWNSFFSTLPKTYNYPFIGTKKISLNGKSSKSYLYFVNPIFDLNSLKNDHIYGYFMMTFDPNILYKYFNNNGGQLVVYLNGRLLLNSSSTFPEIDRYNPQLIKDETNLTNFGLKIVGIKNKNDIKSSLNNIVYTIAIVLFVTWLLTIFLISSFQHGITRRVNRLTTHFNEFQNDPFIQPLNDAGNDEISFMVNQFNQMTSQLQEYIQKISTVTLQKHNAEFYALKMQINPHFLYNTLESLRMQAIALKQNTLADKLYILGKLFRWILKSGNDTVSIPEELEFVENYLELFNLGKSNPIELETEANLDLTQYTILKFIFQPIIENAILHGKLDTIEEPIIHMKFSTKNNVLYIKIINNGLLPSEDQISQFNQSLEKPNEFLESNHFGLKNVQNRIRSYYGTDYGIKLFKFKKNTVFGILLKLPMNSTS